MMVTNLILIYQLEFGGLQRYVKERLHQIQYKFYKVCYIAIKSTKNQKLYKWG